MRTVFFQVKLRTFRGSHLKLWDYFNHVLTAPGFTARVAVDRQTSWDDSNPWRNAREYVVDDWRALPVDAFFVGGRQWELAEFHPDWGPQTPVINLLQHVHHAEIDNERFQYLSRPAIRICVSEEVREAVRETGQAREPLLVIPNGIDLSDVLAARDEPPDVDVLIAALKRPDLGRRLYERLQQPGRRVRLLTEFMQRPDYLGEIERARVTAFLPNETEGFYLPALEGLAAGTLVVCPDCVGNRSFCLPGYNAWRPSFAIDEIAGAVEAALALPEPEAAQMRRNAAETVNRYTLQQEREAFHGVLARLDEVWGEAQANAPAPKTERELRKERRQARRALRAEQQRDGAGEERPAATRRRNQPAASPGGKQDKRQVKVKRLKMGESHYAQLPGFIIIGAQKGGTNALYRTLTRHPDVGSVLKKEIHFFSWSFEKGMPWYLSHFPEETAKVSMVGEVSTSYLSDPATPARVRQEMPDVKLIALLRNPVDRAYQHYLMNAHRETEPLSFEEAIGREPERLGVSADQTSAAWRRYSYLSRGRYAEHLRRWLEVFPREQLLIIQSERFFADPERTLDETIAFLDLPEWNATGIEASDSENGNDMTPATRARLAAYFEPLNRELYDLLGYEFDWDRS